MKRALFIGNGLNQLADQGASWRHLMNQMAGDPSTEHEKKVRDAKPFTLWFQELHGNSSRNDLKPLVASLLETGLKVHQCHRELMALEWPTIITTNYDYMLQSSSDLEWTSDNVAPESYYSLFRRHLSNDDKKIWHIHGELNNPQSIMLGHDQYAGYLHKIGSFLTTGVETKAKGRLKKPYLSKYAKRSATYKGDKDSWVDHFLSAEIHMVGFGLDYTENHLWNLIIKKQRLRRRYPSKIGSIVFHRCTDKLQTTADEARSSLLSAFGAKVIDHKADSYVSSYKNCIEALR